MKSTKTATKEVTVLNVYKFSQIARICFEVLSSNETDKYNCCFNRDAQHASCNCPATSPRGCYHINQLRPRAQEYFDSCQAAAPVATAQTEEKRHNAPLNNNNRGFSLMR